MRRIDFWFLFRFLIIALIYTIEFLVIGYEFLSELDLILHPIFFIPLLGVYFIIIIVAYFMNPGKNLRLKFLSDIIFLCIFSLWTLFLFVCGLEDIGDAGFAFVGIMLYLPMYVCFIIWFIRDIRSWKSQ